MKPFQRFAHRGGPRYAPENTLAAFRHALTTGVDGVECDVQLARDGQIVILHDETLDRTTSGHGPVSALSAAELHALDAGRGEPVPLLREMLDLTRPAGARLLIELKSPRLYPGVEQKVIDLLRQTGDLGRSVMLSFEWDSLARVRALAPEVELCALHGGWSFPFASLPEGTGSIGPMAESALLNPGVMAGARARDLRVRVWFGFPFLEAPWLYRWLRARGVDSITADDPLALARTFPA